MFEKKIFDSEKNYRNLEFPMLSQNVISHTIS